MGTVVDSPVDFYHSRIPKKQRKQTVVDELLIDADMRRLVFHLKVVDLIQTQFST